MLEYVEKCSSADLIERDTTDMCRDFLKHDRKYF